MSKTTKISFAPDDTIGGQIAQRHHHVQTDEDLYPPVASSNQCHSAANPPSASRTINGYLLMERLEKLELGQERLSAIILELTSSVQRLHCSSETNLQRSSRRSSSSSRHRCLDAGVQTEEALVPESDVREREREISRLRKELGRLRTLAASTEPGASKTKDGEEGGKKTREEENDSGRDDFESESPLNLFIECFKKKYDVAVHPNDVAIFV